MSYHFSMGAINKKTLKYEYPKIANKINKYKCPSCDKDVIFRNGKVKQPHYAHKKSDNPCYYYDRPSESQIHKDAKMLMKMLLDNNTNMIFYRKCNYCDENEKNYIVDITQLLYNNTNAVIEYKFHYNNSNRSADVALIKNIDILYIFEICYKNKTKEENRPEPWFEIDAENLIKYINTNDKNNKIEIECKREYKCEFCINKEILQQQNRYKMLERLRIKEKEQKNELNEMFNMEKEDERTIQIKYKIVLEKEKEKLERENLKKQLEYERELERKKIIEKQKKEDEYLKKLLEQNNKCSICKINYCKCDMPNFIIDNNKKTVCVNCIKMKCKCVKITNFFKK